MGYGGLTLFLHSRPARLSAVGIRAPSPAPPSLGAPVALGLRRAMRRPSPDAPDQPQDPADPPPLSFGAARGANPHSLLGPLRLHELHLRPGRARHLRRFRTGPSVVSSLVLGRVSTPKTHTSPMGVACRSTLDCGMCPCLPSPASWPCRSAAKTFNGLTRGPAARASKTTSSLPFLRSVPCPRPCRPLGQPFWFAATVVQSRPLTPTTPAPHLCSPSHSPCPPPVHRSNTNHHSDPACHEGPDALRGQFVTSLPRAWNTKSWACFGSM